MDKIKNYSNERANLVAQYRAEAEGDAPDADKLGSIEAAINALSAKIDALTNASALEESQEEMAARSRGRVSKVTEFGAHIEKAEYSINKAFREGFLGKLTGVEREAHEELLSRGTASKNGGVLIPFEAKMRGMQLRADLTTSTGTGAYPTNTEPTVIQTLLAKTLADKVGVSYVGNIRGIDKWPKQTANASVVAAAESANGTASSVTVGSVSLTPHPIVGYQIVSKMFLNNSAFDGEKFLYNELTRQAAVQSDKYVFAGLGSGNEPTGVLYDSGIATVSVGTNGGAATWALVNQLISSVDAANALADTMYFVTTPLGRAHFNTTVKVSGYPQFLMDADGTMAGFKVISSNQLPSTLTKGTGTGLSAVIFGDFSQAVWGTYGDGLEIYFDPYTSGPGSVKVAGYMEMDTLRTQSGAFSAIVDLKA